MLRGALATRKLSAYVSLMSKKCETYLGQLGLVQAVRLACFDTLLAYAGARHRLVRTAGGQVRTAGGQGEDIFKLLGLRADHADLHHGPLTFSFRHHYIYISPT